MGATALTERYVQEVVRRIPADQRGEVAAELRAVIADTVEARGPDDPEAAERAVLAEMGDPVRLAADYSDRQPVLIGPDLYPAYVRLLAALLCTLLPVATVALAGLDVLDGEDIGSVIGTAVGTAVTVAAQLIAWVTVVFALVERSRGGGRIRRAAEWTPDDLPEPPRPDRGATASYLWAGWKALLIGLIVWQHTARPYRAAGADGGIDRLEVLHPGLWSGWIWPMLAGLAGVVVLELVRVAARGWTLRTVGWYAAAEALFTLPFIWVAHRQMLFNPDFLTDFNGGWTTPDAFYTLLAAGAFAVSATAVANRFRAARARQAGR
ncbi:HAAS signaling domain-containing protein [Nocardiopsis composta]|uniref:Uncharacterized protein n=1 Tax=Nocardiopsis composta TaxID=157465 RepID=A0A7W8VFJ3_9ACTN|nr:hypothetical protein [Nocardiopsis composta]MBB5434034.1 hypothetical protein [Nocardiopsis composta]